MKEDNNQVCPSCGHALEKIPKRTAGCPHCKESILVRNQITLYPSRLLNSEEAEVYDALILLQTHGVTLEKFKVEKSSLTDEFTTKGMSAPSDFDVIWGIYNQLVIRYGKDDDPEQLSYVYHTMAHYLATYDEDHYKILLAAKEARLHSFLKIFKKDVTVGVQVMTNACSLCSQFEGKQISVSDALRNAPIPHKDCQCELYCMCDYSVVGGW